ncbi:MULTISPECIES: mCpol domain-containing protein [unclassified Nostoc]|uniref:mCpol domain-containing protein n=1 Tax=unclassified Nostoc TaxID=2593658 RepID=UPI002AD5248C|nr:mCpol domain-containing protein [Nostoc sp. DedQUE03]MDZ7975209.1 mCpol domain-containing protein [Nostoc sp. DedQUE03]MDZ8048825.1 mCpol domain-containing protein [Nostoc sp. DedQUE02]
MVSLYLAADGDDVGRKIELFIVTDQIELLSNFSHNFQSAMLWLAEALSDEFNAKIIFNGGDSLLARLQSDAISVSRLENLRIEFANLSKATLSFGIGDNSRQAYFALKLAKATGKNRIEIFQEYTSGETITPCHSKR